MRYKVFVDGQEGTTGLKINERLENRSDIELMKISPDKRKDVQERKKFLNEADIVFLCLPDQAAKESVSLVTNPNTRIIDASTAHRTNNDWAYGLPELDDSYHRKIADSSRVANPGCYATGFNILMYPLVKEGIVPKDYPVSCHALSGYSGAGKKTIQQYEAQDALENGLGSPRLYALGLTHKHLPEMQKISGLLNAPIFSPIICNYYEGMVVAIPLLPRLLSKNLPASSVQEFFAEYYKGKHFVKVIPFESGDYLDNGFLGALGCNNTNNIEIYTFGHQDHIMLVSRLDNLGKGASGAAVQNMNIMLGLDESIGL